MELLRRNILLHILCRPGKELLLEQCLLHYLFGSCCRLVELGAWQPIEEGTEGNTQLDKGEYLFEVHKLSSILVGSDQLVDGESPCRVAGLPSKLGQVPDLLRDVFQVELFEADASQRLTTLNEHALNPLTMLALARPLQNALPVRDDQLRLRSLGSHWTDRSIRADNERNHGGTGQNKAPGDPASRNAIIHSTQKSVTFHISPGLKGWSYALPGDVTPLT